MAVRLLVKQRSEAGGADKSTEVLLDEDTINLGRDKTCHVVLGQQAVSRSHARISKDGQLFFIEDLGSAYGTRVNRQELPHGEKRLLRNGDVIAIAQFDVTFERISDAMRQASNGNTSFVARQAVKDMLRVGDEEPPTFRFMNGPREGERIEVPTARELLIGRDDELDIVLRDDLVSRRHAKVRRDWSGTHIEDLQSRNGVKVNKKRVTLRTLKDRDEVEIGGIRLLYIDPAAVPDAAISLLAGEGPSLPPDDAEPLPNGTSLPEPEPNEVPSDNGEVSDEASASEAGAEEEVPQETAPPPDPLPEERPAPRHSEERDASRTAGGLRSTKTLLTVGSLGLMAIAAIVVIVALLAGA